MLGLELRKARESRGLNQKDAARLSNTTQQAISRMETDRGTTVSTVENYLRALRCELIVEPSAGAYDEDSFIYQQYRKASRKQDVVLSHVAALETLGLFSGYTQEYPIDMYAIKDCSDKNIVWHPLHTPLELGTVFTRGMRCTDVNRTINDVLESADTIDDTVILESLNYYYYKHGKSFDSLALTPRARAALQEYGQDAIDYC